MNNQLSPNFTLAELTHTDTGLDNTPNSAEYARLQILATFLEKIRKICGNRAMPINSAFRSYAVNVRVGGVPTSAHRLCYAADFNVDGMTPYEVCVKIDAAQKAGQIDFDQLIQEGTWVHCSRDPRLRGERLTLNADHSYADGIHET